MAHASHANAALTPKARLRLGRLVVEEGWTVSAAARRFEVSYRTAKRWADRYREVGAVMGQGGMVDRSSRPHRSPRRTPAPVVRQIVRLRWRKRLGPVPIAARLGLPASTVHAVLSRCRINRLSHIDRRTGEPVRRYEHERPGSLLHRTLADGWAFARHYPSELARRAALPTWLHDYNHHRPHTATGNQPPFTRSTNVPGHHT